MNYPIVRLELEGVRESVVHALADRNGEIEHAVQAEIDNQINNFDFTSHIREEVSKCLREMVSGSLKRHISWTLEKEIADAVEKMIADRLTASNAFGQEEKQ